MTDELVERLREAAAHGTSFGGLMLDAADEIERLRYELDNQDGGDRRRE